MSYQKEDLDNLANLPLKPDTVTKAGYKAFGKRVSEKWLPAGKNSRPPRSSNVAPDAQVDLEDAVEKAGGRRGSVGRSC